MAIGMSMVVFSEEPKLSVSEIQRHLAERFPDLPATTDPLEKDGQFAFSVGGADVILAIMPAPIPSSDLEGPCATSILWPNAAEELKDHKSHVIVTASGEIEPVPLSVVLTQATVAVMDASPAALGVFWYNASHLVRKDIFTDFSVEVMPHGPPLHIWVDFRVGNDGNRASQGFTAGMIALGHMEFETQNCPEPPGELRERFLALAGYVVENGPVIRDGDTVGEDANERIRVVYSDSAFGHEDKVMRLVYEQESPKKPWWKLW